MKNMILENAWHVKIATATAYLAGEIVVEGALVGVALGDAEGGYVVVARAKGAYLLPKDGSAYTVGQGVDASGAQGTIVTAGVAPIGYVLEAAAGGDTEVLVALI